jgi:hypothetical protein
MAWFRQSPSSPGRAGHHREAKTRPEHETAENPVRISRAMVKYRCEASYDVIQAFAAHFSSEVNCRRFLGCRRPAEHGFPELCIHLVRDDHCV